MGYYGYEAKGIENQPTIKVKTFNFLPPKFRLTQIHLRASTLQAVVSPGQMLRYEEKPLRASVCFFDQAAVQRYGQIN